MTEAEKLQAELDLVEQLLRAESSHLQELQEKRRMIAEGLRELEAPSDLWARYVEEIDGQIEIAGTRLEDLQRLREATRAQLAEVPVA
jgi:septal ring factor EnvC (AmiA/AmiB activator)